MRENFKLKECYKSRNCPVKLRSDLLHQLSLKAPKMFEKSGYKIISTLK